MPCRSLVVLGAATLCLVAVPAQAQSGSADAAEATGQGEGGPAKSLLLQKIESGTAPTGHNAAAKVAVGPFKRPAIVFATAHGSGSYAGDPNGAGLKIALSDGAITVKDDSFEALAANIGFDTSVSHSFYLKAGETRNVNAILEPMGPGGLGGITNHKVQLSVIALVID